MPKAYTTPAAVNPDKAGWKHRLVKRVGDEIALASAPTDRCVGVVVSVNDWLGGEVGVALPGEEAELLLGADVDVTTTDLISPDEDGAGAPSAGGSRPACILAQQSSALAGRTVPVRVLDGLTTI